jgi:hypothetical protein
MDLKKFESAVAEYKRRESKKRSTRLVVTGRVDATANDLRTYARRKGFKSVVIA